MTTDDVLEAWRTNNRITLYLLAAISEEGLRSTLSTRGGRDVARQMAHLHNVRIYHLEGRAKELAAGLEKLPGEESPSRETLAAALEASGEAVGRFLADVAEGKPGRRGFRKGLATTLAYFVAHESHHRGSIVLTLKQSGHPVPKEVRDGLWDWDRR